jgi:hypothetical protein
MAIKFEIKEIDGKTFLVYRTGNVTGPSPELAAEHEQMRANAFRQTKEAIKGQQSEDLRPRAERRRETKEVAKSGRYSS